MDSKSLRVLEYDKILERLAGFCDFSASTELARALQPTSNFDEAQRLLAETTEARLLLSAHDLGIGGSHDIRPAVDLAARGGVLDPQQLLDIKSTLIACRELKKYFEKSRDRAGRLAAATMTQEVSRPYTCDYPRLAQIATGLPETYGIVDMVTRVLSERGEVLDSASVRLDSIRHEMKIAHDRLMSRLQRYLKESASKLQEPIITQRDGRYVIPLRAEFKGQIKAVIHDQSSTGATLFIEPLPVVELNNEMRELQLQERDEERRILTEISTLVGAHAVELKYGIENLAVLDLTLAKAKYAEEIKASEPILHSMEKERGMRNMPPLSSSGLYLIQARHPLLDPQTVVPIDVDPKPGTYAIVITGPNTGGKTVSLKTVGLLALMAQSGLHIPAQSGSELPCFQDVFADIGDEQSIEQSLSTFSSHLTTIIRILKKADQRALVVLDELGAGTDPQEGAALARAILAHLIGRGVTTLVATHYPELKTFAHSMEGVVNASLEFDIRTLRPTYHLTIGLPGRSNALLIAQRLGLDEQLVAAARSEINPAYLRADKLLDDIRKERNRTSREREKLEKVRIRLESQARELEKRLEKIEDERREVLATARAEGELELAILQKNLEALKGQLRNARQPLSAIKEIEEKIESIQEKIESPVERRREPASWIGDQFLKLGDKVSVASLDKAGIITALTENDAEVQIGSLRVRARLSDLERKGEIDTEKLVTSEAADPSIHTPSSFPASPGIELSLRGKLVEDGLDELEKYLEKAYSAGLPFVRIVHGKGTGRMRAAVRVALKESPYVSSFEDGGDREGGAGVTVAKLST
jgi:DNA mismatch repair protein MutS2